MKRIHYFVGNYLYICSGSKSVFCKTDGGYDDCISKHKLSIARMLPEVFPTVLLTVFYTFIFIIDESPYLIKMTGSWRVLIYMYHACMRVRRKGGTAPLI